MTPIQLKKIVTNTLEEHKATNISTLDVRKITDISDYLIICSATSSRHIRALSDHVIEAVKKHNVKPIGHEGRKGEHGWALIDLGDVIIHIMVPEVREFYNLEKLWDFISDEAKAEKLSKKIAKDKKAKPAKTKKVVKTSQVSKAKKGAKTNKTTATAKKIKSKIKNTKVKPKPKQKSNAEKKYLQAKSAAKKTPKTKAKTKTKLKAKKVKSGTK